MFSGLGIDKDFLDNGIPMNFGGLTGAQELIKEMPSEHKDSINELFNQELSGIIDFRLWSKMVQLQKDFNNRVAPNWETDHKQENFDFWMAILDETVEVLGSRHWKWWKDKAHLGEVDWDNMQVEFIDIFHFMLSVSLQMGQQDSIFMTMMAFEKNNMDGKSKAIDREDPKMVKVFFDKFWHEFLMAVWQKSIPLTVVKWCELYYISGGNFEILARDYFIKNALNDIRQEFGYSDGRYQKKWRHPSDSSRIVEDNVVAGILLKSTDDLSENSVNEMKDTLRKYYLEFVTV